MCALDRLPELGGGFNHADRAAVPGFGKCAGIAAQTATTAASSKDDRPQHYGWSCISAKPNCSSNDSPTTPRHRGRAISCAASGPGAGNFLGWKAAYDRCGKYQLV